MARAPLYPFLVAGYLVMTLVAERAGGWSALDLGGSLVLALFWALIAWWMTGLVPMDPRHRPLVSLLAVLWAGLYGSFVAIGAQLLGTWLAHDGMALAVWTLGFAGLGLGLRGLRSWDPSRVTTAANVGALILVSMPAATLVLRSLRAPSTPRPAAVEDRRTPDRPDVVLIVLDKYSHPRWLREVYGVDVTPFLDSLRGLGFVVPDSARTNYVHTSLTLAALLNWAYVHEGPAPRGDPWEAMALLIEDSEARRLLAAHGYRVAFFPTSFPTTRSNRHADIVLAYPGRPLGELGSTWLANAPWPALTRVTCRLVSCRADEVFPYPVESAEAIEWKLAQVAGLADSTGPIFAFLHLLAPHEPYVFDANCRHRRPVWPRSDVGTQAELVRELYAAQVACVNRLVIQTVTSLIARSAVPPTIILQADHGHGRIAIDPMRGITVPLEALSREQVEERLDVFAAYRFPEARRVVWNRVSPVNVLPMVLNSVLGVDLPVRRDRAFWSDFNHPLAVTEIPR
ncbi:MAG: sulfatase-like hydrolase/transferase [Gemmatimonadales bacterium]